MSDERTELLSKVNYLIYIRKQELLKKLETLNEDIEFDNDINESMIIENVYSIAI